MNKKGFTLTEIIGAIIILGILVVIAVVTFTGSMKGFREDYYTDTVRTLTESGKEFFNDNRKYRPSEVLNGQVVPLSTLVSQHYIDDIKDYNGNSCSSSSYVIVIKNGKDDYTYHTCLVCPGDDFSNMDDNYCDAAWTNSTTIEYSIAKPPELYVYKGTPKSTLKEELGIKVSYVKKNSKGEVIGVVDGTGFDDVPVIYPDDVDGVDTNKLGTYELTYRYQDQVVKGHVTIYEFNEPTLVITKTNVRATNLGDGKESITNDYSSGEWAQKINVTLTAGSVDAGGVNVSTASLSNVVHQFQWNKDGIWQDFCGGDNCSNREVSTEMNESIRFRSIDVNGVASEETRATIIRIDHTQPACNLKTEGPHKDNEWFTGNVNVSFQKNEDLVGDYPEAVSGIKTSNITIEGGSFNRNNLLNITHTTDTTGVKYIGFVEDQAFNSIKCEIWFQKDATAPVCGLKTTGTMGDNDWYKSSTVSTSFNQYYDVTSGVKQYGIGSYTGDRTISNPDDTGGITYTGYIKDVAGNTATCTVSYKKDSTQPVCSLTTTGTMGDGGWYKSSTVGVSFASYTDNLSGVSTYGIGSYTGNKTATQTANTTSVTYTGYIKDNAGNTNTCPITFKKDDGTEAANGGCSSTGNTSWVAKRDVTITNSLNVSPVSGCVQGSGVSGCTYSYKATAPAGTAVATRSATGHTFTTTSGITITCPNFTEQVYVDDEKPLCTSSGGNTAWVNTDLTIVGTCNDQAGSGCTAATVSLPTFTSNTERYNVSPGTVKDKVGNETTCPGNQTVKIDKTPPTCSSASSPPSWTNGKVTVLGTCADTGGSGCVQDISKEFSGQQDTMKSPGTVYDNAGNSKTCPTSAVKIDTTKPTCTSSSSPAGWTNGDVTVTGKCTDTGGSGCAGNATQTYSGQQDTTKSPGTVRDNAGNVSDACPVSAVKIDTTKPTCTSSSNPSGWTNGSVTVTGKCTDTGGSGCAGNATQTYSGQQNTTKSPGTVRDNAGNVSDACPVSAVKIDTTKPTCTSTSSPAGWTNGSVTVTGKCTDTGGSGCAGNATKSFSGQQNTTKSPGTVRDNAGNVSDACPVSAVKIDTTPPTCTSSSSSPSGWTNGSVTVTGKCSDTGGSGCAGNAVQTFSGQQNTTKSPGKVYDKAGNVSTSNCPTSSVKIDTTKPTCGSVTYGGDATGGVSVSIACSDTGGSSCSAKSTTATASGSLTLKDGAGNTVSCSYKVSSYTQNRTRTWNTCLTGSPNECQGAYYTGYCSRTEIGGYDESEGSYGDDLYVRCYQSTNCYTGWCCTVYEKCQLWNSCATTVNTCAGGWNGWSGYSNGTCTSSNTSTWECDERTMYHGG